MYAAIDAHRIDVVTAYSTDGRIAAHDLVSQIDTLKQEIDAAETEIHPGSLNSRPLMFWKHNGGGLLFRPVVCLEKKFFIFGQFVTRIQNRRVCLYY